MHLKLVMKSVHTHTATVTPRGFLETSWSSHYARHVLSKVTRKTSCTILHSECVTTFTMVRAVCGGGGGGGSGEYRPSCLEVNSMALPPS